MVDSKRWGYVALSHRIQLSLKNTVQQTKPVAGETVYFHDIPGHSYSLRFWDGGGAHLAVFMFGLYDRDKKSEVLMPEGYAIYPLSTLFCDPEFPEPPVPLPTWAESMSIHDTANPRVPEMYCAQEGSGFRLSRHDTPQDDDVYFTIPTRPRQTRPYPPSTQFVPSVVE